MEILAWWTNNWWNFFSSVGLMGSLCFLAIENHKETKSRQKETTSRQTANLLSIAAAHRDIWQFYIVHTELRRVKNALADTTALPVNEEERTFVNIVIQHMNSVFYAMTHDHVIEVEGFKFDIAQFLSLPVPKEVWGKLKRYQNADFVAFVESCRNQK